MTVAVTHIQGYAKRLLEPSRHYVGPVIFNRMGLQVVRCAAANVAYRLRIARRDAGLAKYTEQLDQDGICVIRDLLPAAQFDRLAQAYEQYRSSPAVKEVRNKNNTGVTWYEGPITNKTGSDPAAQAMIDLLSFEPRIVMLASYVLRRRVEPPLLLGYQCLYLPEGESDDRDVEGALHADRHYPCVKVAYYINDNTVDNGAYVFCRGSHRLTWHRLRHEQEFSVRQREWQKGGPSAALAGPFERARPVPSPAGYAEMALHETPIEAPANTLVLSNNMGFHKRGRLSPGRYRKQIRILFYEFQSPLLARLVRRRYKREKYGLTER